jgi:hypothetical protein
VSISSRVIKMTGIAFAWMAPTTLFGSVVKNAKMSFVVSPSFIFRTEVQRVQTPAKKASGRVSSNANQTGGAHTARSARGVREDPGEGRQIARHVAHGARGRVLVPLSGSRNGGAEIHMSSAKCAGGKE